MPSLVDKKEYLEVLKDELAKISYCIAMNFNTLGVVNDLNNASKLIFKAIGKIIVCDDYNKEMEQSRYETEIENKIDYEQENK